MSQLFEPKADYVRYQSDGLVLKLARFVWPMHIITAGLLTALFLINTHPAMPLVYGWMSWMVIFGGVQGAIAFRGAGRVNRSADLEWLPTGFDVTAISLACAYGFLAFVLVPTGDPDMDRFVGFIITGGVLTGTGTHNPRYRMLALTLLIIIPLLALRTLLENSDGRGAISAGMLLVFLVLMLGLGWGLRSFMRQGFLLQWEKMQLAAQLETQAEDLKRARAEADAANQAKSKFLAQASHDLRQPLHSMGLFLASLRHEALTPRASEITDRLSQSIDILSELFSTLLDVTLMDTQRIEMQPVSLAVEPFFREITDEFQPITKAHTLHTDIPGDLCISADPLALRRMIQNLVSNAIRHTPQADIILSARISADGVYLLVQDDGPGIAADEQERIFREFERGNPVGSATRGLGLGLSIVTRLATLSGVRVSLASAPGQGATFTLGPFAQAGAEPDTKDLSTPDIPARHPGDQHVLIIDDHRPTLEATAAILSRWGWDMDARTHLTAEDVNTLRKPDLIITDFDLGSGTTGLDILTLVRARFGDLPALIISGSSTDDTRELVKEAGLTLLHKPVRPVQLRSALIALLG